MAVWYRDGLSFQCTQCGRCCGGGPGVVWVDLEEIRRIAQFVSMHPDDLWGPILRRVGLARISLTERSNGDCVFLKRLDDGRKACSIYPVRPQQCRTWPFWNSNLRTRPAWQQAAATCPGMDRGQHYDLAGIEAIRTAEPWHRQAEGQRREAGQ